MDNIAINRLENNIIAFNVALGSKKGAIRFTSNLDTTNHVVSENDNEVDTINVPVEVLDDILENQQIPLLLKIDTEGYETEVLTGAHKILINKNLKAIIIELNGSGNRYGYDEQKLHKMLLELDFNPFLYNPEQRLLTSIDSFGTHNTLYIRDVDFVQNRLNLAGKIKILDNEI